MLAIITNANIAITVTNPDINSPAVAVEFTLSSVVLVEFAV